MNSTRNILLVLLLIGMIAQTAAQPLDLLSYLRAPSSDYQQFTAIVYNGESLVEEDTPDGPLRLSFGMTGKLGVSAMNRGCNSTAYNKLPIGFRVAIKDYETNTLWLYSAETLIEVDLEDLLSKCTAGDSVIFMTTNRKYRLPRHEIVVMGGC